MSVTANDKLRELLDERGVSWDYGTQGATTTAFSVNEVYLSFMEFRDGLCCTTILSPEQVMQVYQGCESCRDLAETPRYRDKTEFECSECCYRYSTVGGFGCDCGDEPDFQYCPNCGRKVVGE